MKGQTAKAVEAFLRAEGWKHSKKAPANWWYWDKNGDFGIGSMGAVREVAYRVALRRKAQRERAALKRAGFSFSKVYGLWECRNEWLYTKEKALEIVEGSQGTPRRGK
jgi:hypothetical protein